MVQNIPKENFLSRFDKNKNGNSEKWLFKFIKVLKTEVNPPLCACFFDF